MSGSSVPPVSRRTDVVLGRLSAQPAPSPVTIARRIVLGVAVLFACVVAPASASAEYFPPDRSRAQTPTQDPEFWDYQDIPFEHDRGFFLRLNAAPMWFVSRTREVGPTFGGSNLRLEGGGLDAGVAVGAIVAPNLALHGTATVLLAPRPRVVAGDLSTRANGLGLTLIGFGPGLTGYLPNDVWGSLAFGGSVVMFDFERDGLIEPDNGYGIYFEMSAGKDWWVSSKAGVGIFGRLTTHRVTTDYAQPFGGVSLSFGVSATLN